MWIPIMMNDPISETWESHGATMEITHEIDVDRQCDSPSGPAPQASASNPGDRRDQHSLHLGKRVFDIDVLESGY